MIGQAIVELGLPADFLIILVVREKDFIQPSGQTVLQVGDTLLVLADKKSFEEVQSMITADREKVSD